ncbi:MAG TPA: hypothetical protein VE888_13300 [Streptosporangiaceae bacterium]|nr:hypothetical protein [Streptosporangiaceae bacterium]
MRPAYGAEEIGIFGHDATIVVDVANVMGSRPDGWWRDRAGAAVRLHDQIAELAASGQAILPGDAEPGKNAEPGENTEPGEDTPAFVLVLEGAARAAIPRLPSAVSSDLGNAGPLRSGEVRIVEARGSGDDAIVAVVHELPGRRVVVTADRELRARCAAAGAEILGPGWLLGLLREPRSPQAPGG